MLHFHRIWLIFKLFIEAKWYNWFSFLVIKMFLQRGYSQAYLRTTFRYTAYQTLKILIFSFLRWEKLGFWVSIFQPKNLLLGTQFSSLSFQMSQILLENAEYEYFLCRLKKCKWYIQCIKWLLLSLELLLRNGSLF